MTESPYVNSLIEGACERSRLERACVDLLRILRKRFPGVLTADVLAAIEGQPTLAIMDVWFDAAIDAFSAEAFLAVLRR